MILRYFISLQAFTVYMENSLRFEISLRSIWPKWISLRRKSYKRWKLPHTEVRFYPEVKSQTVLSSLRVSCNRALWKRSTRKLSSIRLIFQSLNHIFLISPSRWEIDETVNFQNFCKLFTNKFATFLGHFGTPFSNGKNETKWQGTWGHTLVAVA